MDSMLVGLGTAVNAVAVIVGGCIGLYLKKGMSERFQTILMQTLGISTIFIGIAGTLQEVLTEQLIQNLSFVGSRLIVCVGVNMFCEKKIKVANLLPSLVFVVIFSYVL